jgi:hypothetical protein
MKEWPFKRAFRPMAFNMLGWSLVLLEAAGSVRETDQYSFGLLLLPTSSESFTK